MPRIRAARPKKTAERRFQTANRDIVEQKLPDPPGAKRAARRTVTVNLSVTPLSWLYHRGYLSQRQFDLGERLQADFERAGLGLESILWRVVCVGESLPDAERALGWPARAGRLVLTLALDRVADYYRIG